MVLALLLSLLLLVPLSVALYKSPTLIATLLGWPGSDLSLSQIKFNLVELAKSYLLFWYPQLTAMGLTPIFGLGSFCLIILGILKLLVDHHAARSYSLAVLLPILLIPVILQPQYAVIFFVPFILLLAIGIEALLDEWYKLFPHNPYARVVALVPLLILLTGIIISNTSRYTSVMRYSPTLPLHYSQDLSLVRESIQKNPTATLVTSNQEQVFYGLLRRDFPSLVVTNQLPMAAKRKPIIVSHSYSADTSQLGLPQQIITDSYKDHGPRFYVFLNR